MQIQNRHCQDGSIDKCEFMDSQRAISCVDAGTQLPACQIGISNFIQTDLPTSIEYLFSIHDNDTEVI